MNPGAQGREQERKPRPFSIPSPLSGGVKAPGLVGVGGHLGCLGGFALDCSGVQPHQGALPRSSEASESTLVTDSSWNGNQGPSYTLSPCDCRIWRDEDRAGERKQDSSRFLSAPGSSLPRRLFSHLFLVLEAVSGLDRADSASPGPALHRPLAAPLQDGAPGPAKEGHRAVHRPPHRVV